MCSLLLFFSPSIFMQPHGAPNALDYMVAAKAKVGEVGTRAVA